MEKYIFFIETYIIRNRIQEKKFFSEKSKMNVRKIKVFYEKDNTLYE